MRSKSIPLVRLIAFILLVFTSACASEKEAPSPIPPNNPQQLQNPPGDAGNKADEEDEKEEKNGEEDEKNENEGEDNKNEKD